MQIKTDKEIEEQLVALIENLKLDISVEDAIYYFNKFYADSRTYKSPDKLLADIFKDKKYEDMYYLACGIVCKNCSQDKILLILEYKIFLVWLSKEANINNVH